MNKHWDHQRVLTFSPILLAKLALIFLFFDFNVTFEILSGGGDRLSTGINADGDHIVKSSITLRIKLADIILGLIVLWLLLYRGKITSGVGFVRIAKILFFFFTLYALVLLALNYSEVGGTKTSVSLIYLTKLILHYFLLRFFFIAFTRDHQRQLVRVMVVVSTLAALVGITASVSGTSLALIMSNRVEYYGQIAVVTLLMAQIAITNGASKRIIGVARPIVLLAIVLGVLSVALSGKRTPLICLAFGMMAQTYFSLWYRSSSKPVLSLLVFIPLIGLGLSNFQERTFVSYAGVDRLSEAYQEQLLTVLNKSELEGLDASTAERLAKIIYSINLVNENPFGVGFWASTYRYSFNPDSMLQFVLENGLLISFVGLAFILVYFLHIFRKKSRDILQTEVYRRALIAVSLTLLASGVFVNIFYQFKLIAMFFIIYGMWRASYDDAMRAGNV